MPGAGAWPAASTTNTTGRPCRAPTRVAVSRPGIGGRGGGAIFEEAVAAGSTARCPLGGAVVEDGGRLGRFELEIDLGRVALVGADPVPVSSKANRCLSLAATTSASSSR